MCRSRGAAGGAVPAAPGWAPRSGHPARLPLTPGTPRPATHHRPVARAGSWRAHTLGPGLFWPPAPLLAQSANPVLGLVAPKLILNLFFFTPCF